MNKISKRQEILISSTVEQDTFEEWVNLTNTQLILTLPAQGYFVSSQELSHSGKIPGISIEGKEK